MRRQPIATDGTRPVFLCREAPNNLLLGEDLQLAREVPVVNLGATARRGTQPPWPSTPP